MNKSKAPFSHMEKGLFCALKILVKFILAFDRRCQNRLIHCLHAEPPEGKT